MSNVIYRRSQKNQVCESALRISVLLIFFDPTQWGLQDLVVHNFGRFGLVIFHQGVGDVVEGRWGRGGDEIRRIWRRRHDLDQAVEVGGGVSRVVLPADVVLKGVLPWVQVSAQFATKLDLKNGSLNHVYSMIDDCWGQRLISQKLFQNGPLHCIWLENQSITYERKFEKEIAKWVLYGTVGGRWGTFLALSNFTN